MERYPAHAFIDTQADQNWLGTPAPYANEVSDLITAVCGGGMMGAEGGWGPEIRPVIRAVPYQFKELGSAIIFCAIPRGRSTSRSSHPQLSIHACA